MQDVKLSLDQPSPVAPGWLLLDGRTVAVEAQYASRYSVWINLADELKADGEEPVRFRLRISEQDVEMGPCRLIREHGESEFRYRLVPSSQIHDFEKLFFRGRREVLESTALNLPLILSYKEQIDPIFKGYVADLTYDLNAYKNLLDRMDEEYSGEPEEVKEVLQYGILDNVAPGLLDYLDNSLEELARITSDYTQKEHEHHGFFFRKQLWNIILCSPIIARTNLKPRGYSGDSEMMRMIYRRGYVGDSSFGKIMHRHPIDQPAAEAVRSRRRNISGILKAYIRERMDIPGSVNGPAALTRILSVACGPAYEVRDIFTRKEDATAMHFSLLDQDEQALLEASAVVRDVEQKLDTELSVDFIKESVRTMLVNRELQDRWGRFDFIYSMGLFDYLTAPVATAVLTKLYQLLTPGGTMVIGNFKNHRSTRYYMEYWLDWKIIYRDEQELRALASRLPGAELEVEVDSTGIQMLLHIRKNGEDHSDDA